MKQNLEKTQMGLSPSICVAMMVIAIVLLASCDFESEAKCTADKPSPESTAKEESNQPAIKSPISLDWLVSLHEKLLSTDPQILSQAVNDFKANEHEIENFAAAHYEDSVERAADLHGSTGSDEETGYRYIMLDLLALADGKISKKIFVDILRNPYRDLSATPMGISYAARKDDESIKELARSLCKTTDDLIILEYCRDNGF